VRIWQSGQSPIVMGNEAAVIGAAFSKDETSVLTWANDNTVKLWDAVTGKLIRTFDHGIVQPTGAALNHAGDRLITWSDDGTLRLWDIGNGALLFTFDPATQQGGALGAIWSANDQEILAWSQDSTARIWDAKAAPSF